MERITIAGTFFLGLAPPRGAIWILFMGWRQARLESILRGGGFPDKVRGIAGESLRSLGEDLFAMRLGPEGIELIAVLARNTRVPADTFEGERIGCGDEEVLFCPFNARNAAALRALFPWCRPSLLGRNAAFGMGYRSPWVLGNLVQARSAARHEVTTVLAQQSARELERTGRTFQEVLDSATWAAFAAGLTIPWGADADHLKTEDLAREAARAGFTLFTYDVADEIREPASAPAVLSESIGPAAPHLLGRGFEIVPIEGDALAYEFTREDLARLEAEYRPALAKLKRLYDATADELGGRPFDVEISLDETETETEPLALVFLSSELARLGVRVQCLAPRFPGNFEKAVDFFDGWTEGGAKNTEVRRFRERMLELAAIARHFGFKLGVHTGSDKFRIYPVLARSFGDAIHVKTAGTIYLEELRVVAARAPALFREIVEASRAVFEKERKSYALSARPEEIPDLAAAQSGEELAAFIRSDPANDHLRQVLHVAYGPMLKQFGTAIRDVLSRATDDLEAFAGEHLSRHVTLCGLGDSAKRFRTIETDPPLAGEAAALRAEFDAGDYLGRLERAEARAGAEGAEALEPGNPITRLGVEVRDERIIGQRLGVFGLARGLAADPDLLGQVRIEADELRRQIRAAHGVELRNIIWAGPSGTAEDKHLFNSLGMLGLARLFVLDSTDPILFAEVLDTIERSAGEGAGLALGLKRTLVLAMASGPDAGETGVHLEALEDAYRSQKIETSANFVCLAPTGSGLDRIATAKGWRRVDLEPHGAQTTLDRHAAPLTRACLYPLALNDHDLHLWAQQTALTSGELSAALDLAAFIEAQSRAGRSKMVLHLPAGFEAAGAWMKQAFEQALGAEGKRGLKVAAGEPIRLDAYFPAEDPRNDRFFVEVEVEGLASLDGSGLASIREAGHPIFRIRLLKGTDIARFLQFIHHAVFALGYLREANVVGSPSLEAVGSLVRRLWEAEDVKTKGMASAEPWQALERTPHVALAGPVSLYFDSPVRAGLFEPSEVAGADAPGALGPILASARDRGIEYAELVYYGDLGQTGLGQELKRTLEEAATACIRLPLKMPVDVGEGPALCRQSFEMTCGWGRGLTIAIVADEHAGADGSGSAGGEYLKAQWIAAKLALEQRGRWVLGLRIPRLSQDTIRALGDLFSAAADRYRMK